MRYFPIFVDLSESRTVLVYGGGEEALRKVRLLLKTQATITLVAPALHAELTDLVEAGHIAWIARHFDTRQLDGDVSVVFSAAGETTDAVVCAAARERNLPVNVVDRSDLSNFIVPAIIDRDPLVVAIGTEGAGPVLAQGLRARIEAMLPPAIGGLLQRAASLRSTIALRLPAGSARRDFWHDYFFGAAREAYLDGDEQQFARAVDQSIKSAGRPTSGRVSLIEVCSDPELLTLKAHRLLQEADIVIFDRSIDAGVLEYARRDAERRSVQHCIWTGGNDDHRQTAETALQAAETSQRVVRLFNSDASALDTELAILRRLDAAGITIESIRSAQTDCTWAPLVEGPSLDQANPWRLAS